MGRSDEGDRNPNLGYFGVLLAIILSCVLVGWLAYLEGGERARRYDTPRAYQNSGKEQAQRFCVEGTPEAVFECVYGHVEASTQAAREEQDLDAQQRSAFSALVSAILAFLSLCVTAKGVQYVKRTLDATLAAVEDTSEATKAMHIANTIANRALRIQYRPNIKVQPLGAYMEKEIFLWRKSVDDADGALRIEIFGSFSVKNEGPFPITILSYDLSIFGGDFNPRKENCYYILEPHSEVVLEGGRWRLGERSPHTCPISTFTLTHANLPLFRMNPVPVLCRFMYEDIIGVRREMGFAFAPKYASPGDAEWVRWGDQRHNFDRELN